MALELLHIMNENLFKSSGFETERIRTIRYGKCLKSPYVENSLWFVTIPIGLPSINMVKSSPKEAVEPRSETTFLVVEQYARPHVIDEFKRDLDKWQEIAHKTLVGDWCSTLEQLWQDVPIYTHTLPNLRIIKYGYCRSQDGLWLVSFKDENLNADDHTFIVDEVCVQSEFINYLGIDWKKWSSVSWCHLMHEVKWDELKTGLDSKQAGRYVLQNNPSVEKIALYQKEMKNVR